MHPNKNHESGRSTRILKHVSTPLNASGIADGSSGEFSWLSQFPSPPRSKPNTRISPGFSIPALGGDSGSSVNNTLHIRHKASTTPVLRGSSPLSVTQESLAYIAPLRSHTPSPHDWHDGASSITMATTEDRLLPTSFITSLLQENVATSAELASLNSDALSGFSEISYPPVASGSRDPRIQSSSLNTSLLRQPGRRPSNAFTPILGSPSRLSEESEISRSGQNSGVKVTGLSDVLPLEGDSVMHIAPSRALPSIPSALERPDGYLQGDADNYKSISSGSPSGTLLDEPLRFSQTQARESTHSTKSLVPSWISRLSASRPVRHVVAWRSVRPLPLIPILRHTPAVETEPRGTNDFQSSDPVSHPGVVNDSRHSHRRRSSRFIVPNRKGASPGLDDSSVVGRGITSLQPKRGPKSRRKSGDWRSWTFCASMIKGNLLAQHKKRTFVILGVTFLAVLIAVGTTLGIVTRRGAPHVCPTGLAGAGCNLSQPFFLLSSKNF